MLQMHCMYYVMDVVEFVDLNVKILDQDTYN